MRVTEQRYRHGLEAELKAAYTRINTIQEAERDNIRIRAELKTLEENSGMSTTLFKITGRLDKGKNRPMNQPKKSQEDVKFESLYQKVARIYPQIKQPHVTYKPSSDSLSATRIVTRVDYTSRLSSAKGM